MANYATLKAAIQQVVKTNGNNEITGALLQQTLFAMVNSLGAGYQFMGIALPSTNPGTPDNNVAYLAGPGTYPNFSAAEIQDGYIGVLKYNGSWIIETVQVGKDYDSDLQTINNELAEIGNSLPKNSNYLECSPKWITNYDGTVSDVYHLDYCHTDFIPISASPNISVQNVNQQSVGFRYYDSSKVFLGVSYSSDARFVRLTFIPTGELSDVVFNINGILYYANKYLDSAPKNELGDLSNLTTENKTDIVSAINELAEIVSPLEEKVNNADENLSLIVPSMKLRVPENYLYDMITGYVTNTGQISDSSSYKHTQKIKVNAGDVFTFWNVPGVNITSLGYRFVCAYLNGVAQSDKGAATGAASYTVPAGVDEIVVSISAQYFDNTTWFPMMVRGTVAPSYYVAAKKPLYVAFGDILPDRLNFYKTGMWHIRKDSIVNGETIQFGRSSLVKNVLYSLGAKITNWGGTLTIGQGTSAVSYHSYVQIGINSITIVINGVSYGPFEHGLTLSGYVFVNIKVDDNTRAKITIFSNGQTYTRTIGWYGFSRSFFFVSSLSVSLNDISYSVCCADVLNAPIHIYGDSYIAIIESTAKWSHWLVNGGYGNNVLINACPGASTNDNLPSLQSIMGIGVPRIVLWACGMNDGADPDVNTPNQTWLNGINSVIDICKNHDVEIILTTIPTVPSILHEGKNKWVRESGYRYVDFARAVGASPAGVWYDGMLSTDGIHPVELGAIALYNELLCDCPDITFNK